LTYISANLLHMHQPLSFHRQKRTVWPSNLTLRSTYLRHIQNQYIYNDQTNDNYMVM
jgi:hypothetical protein